jgi:5'-deoxynucleotidase YfbR-like HD superfamily hydrolase
MIENTSLPEIYESGFVKRWHTHLMPVEQTLGHHQWGVAVIIALLHPNPSVKLLKAALLHDTHEKSLGDWPHSAKTENPALAEFEKAFERKFHMEHGIDYQLEADEQLWLTFADRLESFYFLSSVLFLSPKLMEIRIEALTLAEEAVKGLQSFGYFTEADEIIN